MRVAKILVALTAFFFSVTFTVTNILAKEDRGSINIYLEEGNQDNSLEGVEFKLVKVAEVINGEYIYMDQYKNNNLIDLNNINTADELNNASNDISTITTKNNFNGINKKTNKYGVVQFENLENGVYLIQVININNYGNISPTLVAIPTLDKKSSNTNAMNYNVNIVPKHTPIIAVKTSDESNILLFTGICFIALSVMFITRKLHINNF